MSSPTGQLPPDNILMKLYMAHVKNELIKKIKEEVMPTVNADIEAAAQTALDSLKVHLMQSYNLAEHDMLWGLVIKKDGQ